MTTLGSGIPVEKRTAKLNVVCKPSEKARWFQLFNDRDLTRAVRDFLNKAVEKAERKK